MFAFRLLSYLPLSFLYILSDILYLIVRYLVKYREKVIDNNLLHAFPEKSPAERKKIKNEFYRNFTDSLSETIKLLTMSEEEISRRARIENADIVVDKIKSGEVVIGVTAHFFNWEAHLLSIMAPLREKCEVVYLKVNNPFFEKFMRGLRGRFGGGLVERGKFQRHFLQQRDTPRVIILAADQRPQKAELRYWTSFMNREAAFFEGAEKLAKKFNLTVVYSHVSKPKRGHYVFTYQILEQPPFADMAHSITDRFVQLTEKNIRQEPALYLWSHDRWKTQKET